MRTVVEDSGAVNSIKALSLLGPDKILECEAVFQEREAVFSFSRPIRGYHRTHA